MGSTVLADLHPRTNQRMGECASDARAESGRCGGRGSVTGEVRVELWDLTKVASRTHDASSFLVQNVITWFYLVSIKCSLKFIKKSGKRDADMRSGHEDSARHRQFDDGYY